MAYYFSRALWVVGLLAGARSAAGQGNVTPAAAAPPRPTGPGVPAGPRDWSIHFQQTVNKQWHTEFSPPYGDSLSLQTRENAKLLVTATVFLGRRLWKNGALFFNPEVSGGSGLSGASGVAGALNGETFRVASTMPTLYLAQLYVQQRFALTTETRDQSDDLDQLAGPAPARYLSVTAGKFSLADYFDQNAYSHNPRTQFLNWSLMSAGAWDYPANTRGYTAGVLLEYVSPGLALRAASTLMPTTANGPLLDYDYPTAHAETVELTKTYRVRGRIGTVRLLGFRNVAGMGNYVQALVAPPVRNRPNVIGTRMAGRTKLGLVVNAEQELSPTVGLFGRFSYDDGQNETWAFTEIDRSFSLGAASTGGRWHRPADRLGLAVVANGLAPAHRAYLAAGGYGFILGDGALTYSSEFITELHYSLALPRYHLAVSPDYQLVENPGYNRDRRGPIHVVALRLHVEL
jgi:high affinity Mn2+ porin